MNPNASSQSVLLVDDDETSLHALSLLLTRAGREVTCAGGVAEAVERLAGNQGRFDLVITDMRMPDASGKTILSAIKTAFPETPVIVTTAYDSAELKAECLQLGASAYLVKPINFAQLRATIEELASAPVAG